MRTSSAPALTPNIREAITVHICAVAAAGLFALLDSATYQRPELVALKGMVFAAAVALFLWSIYLTARSCHDGEALKPVVVFVVVILLELMIFSSSLLYNEPSYAPGAFFEYVDYYGCAFYAVFFITLTFLAAPLAWHCVRAESPVHECPDAHELINRAIEVHSLFMLLLTAVLLPPVLFLYCASTVELNRPQTWRHEYLEHCPDFVRDTTADMLALLNSNSNKSLRLRILNNGWTSAEHLESQLTAEPLFESAALNGLLHKPADIAMPVAMGISKNRYYSGGIHIERAANLVMSFSGDAQIRVFLNPETPLAHHFRAALIYEIRAGRHEQYIGDLKELPLNGYNRKAALNALATLMPANELEVLWPVYLCSSEEWLREEAVRLLANYKTDPIRTMLRALDRSNAEIAAWLLRHYRGATPYNDFYAKDLWIERMNELSLSPDVNLQSAARQWLRDHDEALSRKSIRAQTQTEDGWTIIENPHYDHPQFE
jgi:hypothetical protein